MPFSANNPNKNRNYVVAVLSAVILFAVIMGAYVAITLAGKDPEALVRFLTTIVVVLVPSGLGAWQAYKARATAEHAKANAKATLDAVTDGTMEIKIVEGARQANAEQLQQLREENGS